jgi:MFS family permease
MIVLDISIVLTGLSKMHAELGFTDAGLAWVSSAYTLAFGGFLLLAARSGDILGRRRMLIIGLAVFALASLAIGVAQNPAWLILARGAQGIGSAILAPSTLALLQTNFEAGPERTRALSYYAAAAGVSASVGLVLGGVLADWLSWRVGFFINLPLSVIMIIAAKRCIVETERGSTRIDVAGAFASTIGMVALVYGVIRSASTSWTDPVTLCSIAGGLLMLALFVSVEACVVQPIMPLRLFADRERAAAYAARLLFLGANVGFYFFTTQYLQGVMGLSSAIAGIAFLPTTVVNFAAAIAAPRLIAKFGNRQVLIASLFASLVGLAWMGLAASGASLVMLTVPMMLIGVGQGGALGPLTAAGIARVPPEDAGAASGVVNVAHQLGSSLGLGVLVAISPIGAGDLSGPPLLASRVAHALEGGAVMTAVTLVLVLMFIARSQMKAASNSSDCGSAAVSLSQTAIIE